ncbi:hypothetical protein [Mycobacterium sp.]|uniref:hypothetical protein n=1 Tax=Mycobacterium sp. TaxID=1785 RepID=UPI0031D058CF
MQREFGGGESGTFDECRESAAHFVTRGLFDVCACLVDSAAKGLRNTAVLSQVERLHQPLDEWAPGVGADRVGDVAPVR